MPLNIAQVFIENDFKFDSVCLGIKVRLNFKKFDHLLPDGTAVI